jgi:DNA-binding NarL/FixJ family response regulator
MKAPNCWGEERVQSTQPLRKAVRVFVADSSPINSQLLADTLARDPQIEVVGFGSNPDDTFARSLVSAPDILLVSARLDELPTRGVELVRQIRNEMTSVRAIVLLDSSKADIVVEAFRSGASGVFSRSVPIEALFKCIHAVHQGQIWANSSELGFLLRALAAHRPFQPTECNGMLLLSKREREVVQCLTEALTNREIAERLTISQHTVKNYMFRIFEKLGVSNRVELIFYVLSRGNGNGTEVSLGNGSLHSALRQ